MSASRTPEFQINPLFVERWSPRAFTGEPIPAPIFFGILEAARWAPSAVNAQPWRFVYSKNGSASWTKFLEFIPAGNRRWAANASALVVIASKKTFVRNGESVPSRWYSFDAGAAWQNLALQATAFGWHAHAIGGFDADLARTSLRIPEGYGIEIVAAIGKRAEKTTLPPDLQEREAPNARLPLSELAFEASFAS